jgi:hypothetical protein
MVSPIFKIGDTIKVVSRLKEDDGTPIDISGKTIRSVLKRAEDEIVGVNQLTDEFTLVTIFTLVDGISVGRYQNDVRFTEGSESFATPTVVVEIGSRIS